MVAAKKPAAKKTAAKPAAKKPAAKKPAAAPKTTRLNTATKSATGTTEVTVTGRKKIETLQKEFNKKFPYIRLSIYPISEKSKSTKTPYPGDKTIAEVRTKQSAGIVTITGNKKVKTLETEMESIFGIYSQVAYTDKEGNRYFTSGADDEMSLSAFNEYCKNTKCKKDIHR